MLAAHRHQRLAMDSETDVLAWDAVPMGVWLNVFKFLPFELRVGLVPLVCKAWRSLSLSLCHEVTITLKSSRAAKGFGYWLRAHAHQLNSLHITDPFYHHMRILGATRISLVDRISMLQGLHNNGRPLPDLKAMSLLLHELSAADAAVLGLCCMPALTWLKLNSNGTNIGVAGAQGLAPLTQLQQLIVPTQSLGDQGLQILSSNLLQLRSINLHNDGHVTDDGLTSLSSLTALTALDLQGSISITNAGMAALRDCLPQLCDLNVSWCSSVDDWGLLQLCQLTHMTSLNLEASGVLLRSAAVLEALPQLQQLRRLRLDRTHIGQPQLANLAAALPNSLADLSLTCNGSLTSFGELRVLTGLSALTKLDVSKPSHLKHPDAQLTAVFELTQLKHLVMSYVMPAQPELRAQYLPCPPPCALWPDQADKGQQHTHGNATAAVSSGLRTGGTGTSSGDGESSRGTTGDGLSDSVAWNCWWQQFHLQLGRMSHLTELDFRGNLSKWQAPNQEPPAASAEDEAALLLLGFAAVKPQPVLQVLHLSPSVRNMDVLTLQYEHLELGPQQMYERILALLGATMLSHVWLQLKMQQLLRDQQVQSPLAAGAAPDPPGSAAAGSAAGAGDTSTAASRAWMAAFNISSGSTTQEMELQIGAVLSELINSDAAVAAAGGRQQQLQWLGAKFKRALNQVGAEQQQQEQQELLTPNEAAAIVKLALPSITRLHFDSGVVEGHHSGDDDSSNSASSGVGIFCWPA